MSRVDYVLKAVVMHWRQLEDNLYSLVCDEVFKDAPHTVAFENDCIITLHKICRVTFQRSIVIFIRNKKTRENSKDL